MMFESVIGAFRKPLARQKRQNLCFGPECIILGYRSCENGFVIKSTILPHKTHTMFESVSERFANHRHAKQGKTCVSGLNALFWGTEVAKIVSKRNQPFYPIRPQTMFESVSEHFANLWHVKRGKLGFRARVHYFGYRSCENGFRMKSTILPY